MVVFSATIALVGAALLAATHATGTPEPPMGLMIQVSSLQGSVTPATFGGWLDDIRRDHRSKANPGYINAVVLQDIADSNGALYTQYLDVLAPYLPGGATPAFDQAYIGTSDIPWTGSGSKYNEGIKDAAFRNQNLVASATAARAFAARYPRVPHDWYITYEANLAGFWDPTIEGAYRSYLSQLMPALSGVSKGRAFLWSPAFWTMYADEPTWAQPDLTTDLTDLFTNTPSRLSIDLQDFVGQSGGTSTKESAAAWIGYLKQNWATRLSKIEINAEQFKQNPDGSITAGDPLEVPSRENYYQSQNILLGPAFEIRYWHKRLYGT